VITQSQIPTHLYYATGKSPFLPPPPPPPNNIRKFELSKIQFNVSITIFYSKHGIIDKVQRLNDSKCDTLSSVSRRRDFLMTVTWRSETCISTMAILILGLRVSECDINMTKATTTHNCECTSVLLESLKALSTQCVDKVSQSVSQSVYVTPTQRRRSYSARHTPWVWLATSYFEHPGYEKYS
jgi:hypothetical protein